MSQAGTTVSGSTSVDIETFAMRAADIRAEIGKVIVGQDDLVRQVLICLLANAHALLEGVPGLGKTMLVRTIADVIDCSFARIQFTPDLMPADIIGTNVLVDEGGSRTFRFQPGPVFANLVLADEVNRATPRTQSALLEAMAEYQVTVDGTTHRLPEPFFVIATQNPVDLSGTYPLPDSQLDRFLLRLSLGYPGEAAERDLLAGTDRRDLIARATPQLGVQDVIAARQAVQDVHASEALIAYVQALLARSRRHPGVRVGLSPRAGLALLRAARAYALLLGRAHVLPEDVQALFPAVAAHRLVAEVDAGKDAALAKAILHAVPVD